LTRESVFLLAAIGAVLAVGPWVYANQGPEVLWIFSTAVTGVIALFYLAPYASMRGHRGEGAVAVWLAIIFGPLSFIVLIPWATRLDARLAAEQGAQIGARRPI
jgi:hypothetical protein